MSNDKTENTMTIEPDPKGGTTVPIKEVERSYLCVTMVPQTEKLVVNGDIEIIVKKVGSKVRVVVGCPKSYKIERIPNDQDGNR